MKKILTAAAFATAAMVGAAQAAPLNVTVTNVENGKGSLLLAVYKAGDFDVTNKDPQNLAGAAKAPAKAGAVTLNVPDMEPGTYTFVVFHDENDNEDVDTNWLGLPKEGIAFSNNEKINMGPPSEQKMRFEVPADGAAQSVALAY